MSFLKTLLKKKRALNPDVLRRYSNVPPMLQHFIKTKGHLPLSVIKSYADNTGQPIRVRFPRQKLTMFNVKPTK